MSPNFLWKCFMFHFLILLVSGLSVLSQTDKFSNCTVGQRLTHKNTAGRVKILICTEKINGVPLWQYVDGSSTLGEVFNPARDCSDIVDYLPDAKDGFYWITTGKSTKQKVWCDVHTDGGGFMLVGMKNSPVFWTVPSNSSPVDPQGPPHWSSILGNMKVLDFRVQFSTDKSFEGTKGNWLYRLGPPREFGSLFSINNGCPYLQAGINNISFVKDLMTQTVLSNSFKCSKFGQHVHQTLGWGKMNYCLRKDCKYGYAVLQHGVPIIIDKFGSYSYSGVSSLSGMNHNSTAFVGCDQGECCACFGPKGGRQDYCGSKCTAFNGGRVIKKAFVWFWVRTRMPTRLWERCMEFDIKNSAGKLEKHFIDPQTGTLQKGSCSKHLEALLNEGTLTVSDQESLEAIPNVPGLLSYRKDNKRLYVNEGAHWQALSSEQEVRHLEKEVKSQQNTDNNQQNVIQRLQSKIQAQENMIKKLEKEYQGVINHRMISSSCSLLKSKRPSQTSGRYHIYLDGLNASPLVQVYCDMTSKNGVGVTVIGHDSESRIFVKGYPQSPGSYQRNISYEISMEQIVSIINQSKYCEQFIKYECYHN